MLGIGQQRVYDCQRLSRRALLQAGAIGACGWSLDALFRAQANAQAAEQETSPAKSVILLWLWGGPSHLDTFDLKPAAPIEYRGPYRPIATNVPGIEICELLPQLAQLADKYSILRSLNHTSNDHGIAGTIGLTGSDFGATSLSGQVLPGSLKPTHGSIAAKVLGLDQNMPPFVTVGGFLHQGKRKITGENAAGLGAFYDPFRCDYDPDEGVKLPSLQLIDGVSPSGLESRQHLRNSFNGLRRLAESPVIDRFDRYYQRAFSLLTSDRARQVFDLNHEPAELRDRYGRYRFGQCCLLARRLVESGVRFVQVNWSSHVEPVEDTGDGGWDMHDRYFQQYQDRHAWMMDQSVSALLQDLDQRGLLAETVVIAKGEFGRTPKINNKAGRDHWQQVYSALVAGGGLRGGQVVGQSDAKAEYPVARPLTPADLFATVLHQIGVHTTAMTSAGLTPQGNIIEELT